uniref:Uncharacterized protein n=1 Tax=Ditylenchus dipsaci TaxID=166011 RepID=A0A915CUK6_9BILA
MLSSVLGVKCKTETEREVSAVSLQGSFEKHAGYAFHASVEFNHLQRAVTNRKLRTSFFLIFLRGCFVAIKQRRAMFNRQQLRIQKGPRHLFGNGSEVEMHKSCV